MKTILASSLLSISLSLSAINAQAGASSNRQLVLDFVELAFVEKQLYEAFDRYVAPDYVQHNPDAPDGAEAAVTALGRFQQQFPLFIYEVKRVASENDIVFLHVHGKISPEDTGVAIVDIFRVEKGRIVEHWDVIQSVPTESISQHPMF
ncbi:ester cyclase [Pseudomonas sp. FME51]|uniref:nuclear transport factor 2 family protein n=1 Tax=Pseudomonas sp. FME51 TaxID=2742609 RepID=UPI0018685B19|nr:nuclear transport factor 2 family protein [Pseudomonas sp. FME51]